MFQINYDLVVILLGFHFTCAKLLTHLDTHFEADFSQHCQLVLATNCVKLSIANLQNSPGHNNLETINFTSQVTGKKQYLKNEDPWYQLLTKDTGTFILANLSKDSGEEFSINVSQRLLIHAFLHLWGILTWQESGPHFAVKNQQFATGSAAFS